MIIYITRHGQTLWNKKGILQGQKDSSLTFSGKSSAERKGEILQKENIDMIYSSDLGRCVETSEIINKYLKKKIITTPKLRERDFGDLNGQLNQKVKVNLNVYDDNKKAPHGESINDLKKRILTFIEKISNKKFKKVLIVTHEGVARTILSEYYHSDFMSKKCNTLANTIYKLENHSLEFITLNHEIHH